MILELLNHVSKLYKVQWTNNIIVQHATECGVFDPEKLPGYYYQDNDIKVWNAVKKFIKGMVNEFYSTDDE